MMANERGADPAGTEQVARSGSPSGSIAARRAPSASRPIRTGSQLAVAEAPDARIERQRSARHEGPDERWPVWIVAMVACVLAVFYGYLLFPTAGSSTAWQMKPPPIPAPWPLP